MPDGLVLAETATIQVEIPVDMSVDQQVQTPEVVEVLVPAITEAVEY
jgi:hypothetical protein